VISIDLTRLRPGDVIFSLYPASSSLAIAAITASLFSHVMLVLYPDVWFETDGAGSGFKLIENVKAYGSLIGPCTIAVDMPYIKFDVLRFSDPLSPSQLLASINKHIAFRYPDWVEFLPLMIGLSSYPHVAERMVSAFTKERRYPTGSYCSQLVFKVLDETIGLPEFRSNGHISPGSLRRALYRKQLAERVDCRVQTASSLGDRNDQLEHKYSNLLKVTGKLRSYQYPHDSRSFDEALARTFEEMELPLDPAPFSIIDSQLRTIITRPKYFAVHDIFWPPRYR
jgi:hypothetical protein